jgi:hypothetical protein
MSENYNAIPTPSEVRELFHVTYNVFYKKWTDPSTAYDAEIMRKEVLEIDHKYDCQLCRDILGGLVESIDQEIVRRNGYE